MISLPSTQIVDGVASEVHNDTAVSKPNGGSTSSTRGTTAGSSTLAVNDSQTFLGLNEISQSGTLSRAIVSTGSGAHNVTATLLTQAEYQELASQLQQAQATAAGHQTHGHLVQGNTTTRSIMNTATHQTVTLNAVGDLPLTEFKEEEKNNATDNHEFTGFSFIHSNLLRVQLQGEDGDKVFECTECDYKCKRKDKLKMHMLNHTGEKPFSCHFCDYKCKRSDKLKTHLLAHTGERPWQCSFCNYKCTRSDKLKIHTMIHTGEKPFECHICGTKCTTNDRLKTHLLIHSGEKPFACTCCDYRCTSNDKLKRHILVHTGEKPFHCTVCEYKCTSNDKLKTHMYTHTGEKPFACHYCTYRCTRNDKLKIHMMLHTGDKPFECPVCGSKCTTNDRLKTHLLIHSGEKPFHCSVCEYKCISNDKLKRHMLTHTGEKPFACNECDFRCTRSDRLKRHKLGHRMKKKLEEQQILQTTLIPHPQAILQPGNPNSTTTVLPHSTQLAIALSSASTRPSSPQLINESTFATNLSSTHITSQCSTQTSAKLAPAPGLGGQLHFIAVTAHPTSSVSQESQDIKSHIKSQVDQTLTSQHKLKTNQTLPSHTKLLNASSIQIQKTASSEDLSQLRGHKALTLHMPFQAEAQISQNSLAMEFSSHRSTIPVSFPQLQSGSTSWSHNSSSVSAKEGVTMPNVKFPSTNTTSNILTTNSTSSFGYEQEGDVTLIASQQQHHSDLKFPSYMLSGFQQPPTKLA